MSLICSGCVGEPYLSRLVDRGAIDRGSCDYCDLELPVAELSMVAYLCEEAIRNFFEVSSQTMAVVHFDRTPLGGELSDVVANLTRMPDRAVEDLTDALNQRWFDADSGEWLYGEDPWFVQKTRLQAHLGKAWREMEESLRGEARFFNPKAYELLQSIFGSAMSDHSRGERSVLVKAGPGTTVDHLYRARVFETEAKLVEALQWPERFLGPPRAGVGGGGRMNARGLPAFYGATGQLVALSEVRPPVGSRVAVGKFQLIRPLQLLDLRQLGSLELAMDASFFDPATLEQARRRDFLRDLCEKMIAPVMPEMQEHDYLITQVVADYLATYSDVVVDRIIYPSAQAASSDRSSSSDNVVLFHKASVVFGAESDGVTADAELWEYEEDGPGRWFKPTMFLRGAPTVEASGTPARSVVAPSLSLVRESIAIHEVLAVRHETKMSMVEVREPSRWFHR